MAAVERQITVNAPPERVFAYLSDVSRHPEWAENDLKVEKTSDGPIGAGTTFATVGHQLGRDFETEVTITEFAPNERLGYEAKGPEFDFRHLFLIQGEDGPTRLAKQVEPLRVGFPLSLLFPVLRLVGVISRGLDGDLKRIKARLEGGGAAGS